jgi:hypothetical protein
MRQVEDHHAGGGVGGQATGVGWGAARTRSEWFEAIGVVRRRDARPGRSPVLRRRARRRRLVAARSPLLRSRGTLEPLVRSVPWREQIRARPSLQRATKARNPSHSGSAIQPLGSPGLFVGAAKHRGARQPHRTRSSKGPSVWRNRGPGWVRALARARIASFGSSLCRRGRMASHRVLGAWQSQAARAPSMESAAWPWSSGRASARTVRLPTAGVPPARNCLYADDAVGGTPFQGASC